MTAGRKSCPSSAPPSPPRRARPTSSSTSPPRPDSQPIVFGATARRIADDRRVKVEGISRRSSKTARFAWFGETAARGQQATAVLAHLEGQRHWSSALAQGTGFEPPREGAPGTSRREKKDRFDAWVAAAQILLGVRETTRGIVDPASSAGRGWLATASAAAWAVARK